MFKFVAIPLFAAALVCAAQNPAQFPYDEDVVPSQPVFHPQGMWRVDSVAGRAQVSHLGRWQRNHLVGTSLEVGKDEATLWNKMSRKHPFATPINGETVYDTQSREFWLDFRTDPKILHLPRFVTTVDIELGNMLGADGGRVLLIYQGVWYRLSRTAQS